MRTGALSFTGGRDINRLIDQAVPLFLRLYPEEMMYVYIQSYSSIMILFIVFSTMVKINKGSLSGEVSYICNVFSFKKMRANITKY